MLTEIAAIEPFVYQGQTYLDIRTLTRDPDDRQRHRNTMGLLKYVRNQMPPELSCEDDARPQGGRYDHHDLSDEDALGDILPLHFAHFEGLRCVDAFMIYAISLRTESAQAVEISCRILPGFVRLLADGLSEVDHLPWANAALDLADFVSDHDFAMADAQTLDVQTVEAASYHQLGGERLAGDVRMDLVHEQSLLRASGHPTHDVRIAPYPREQSGDWKLIQIESRRKKAIR